MLEVGKWLETIRDGHDRPGILSVQRKHELV